MNSTVDLSFRYSESDYVRAYRAHYATTARLKLDVAASMILALVGVYLWNTPDSRWLAVLIFLASSALLLTFVATFAVIPSLAFRSEPKFRDEYSLTFSPEGIHFRSEHIDSHLDWSTYSRALVDSHSYILYYGSRQFTVTPKRVFQNAEQQQAFDELVTLHISSVVRR